MKAIKILLAMVFILSMTSNAQTIVLKGKITDTNNQPIVGVSVMVKNSNLGTISNVKGEYSLKTEIGKTVIFSFLGFEKQEKTVQTAKLDIVLKADQQQLDALVITGYGASQKKELKNIQYTVAEQAVQGRLAGLSIRGTSSLYGNRNNYRPTPIYNIPENEEYNSYKENKFISVSNEALSTFSLDVDAASYSNVRRMINQGQMPEKDAVRIEEMMNYFSYNYAQPQGEHPVNIITEASICPWNTQHKIVKIAVKAKEIASDNLANSNFVFLIDVSGSMNSANKLELLKSSLKLLVNNLRDKDRVSIVVYAGAAGEVLPSTAGSDRQKIKDALDQLRAGGSTAGGAGIELAYRIAEKNFIKNGNNRIILCTDGDFNVGTSSVNELESLIESKRKTGIYLTVLGYGMGNYKDNKLQTLAEKGNGNHAYIDNIQEANKVLVNEFGSTMYTVANDVKLQVEFNPTFVNAYRLIGYESRMLNKEDFNDDTKDAGELGSGHTVTALYEIIPVGVKNTFGGVDDLKYQKTDKVKTQYSKNQASTTELLTVKLRYKKPNAQESQKLEVPVLASQLNNAASKDFKFTMAVAMFGQLLKDSNFKGNANYETVIQLAKAGLDTDDNGYRKEFIRLVEAVNQMAK